MTCNGKASEQWLPHRELTVQHMLLLDPPAAQLLPIPSRQHPPDPPARVFYGFQENWEEANPETKFNIHKYADIFPDVLIIVNLLNIVH